MNPAKWLLVALVAVVLRFLYRIARRAIRRRRDYEFLKACGIRPLSSGRGGAVWRAFGAEEETIGSEEGTSISMAERR